MLSFQEIVFFCAIYIGLFVTIFSLLTIYQNWGRHRTPLAKKIFPTITIIVPCYNEEGTLARTLDSLLALDYPKNKRTIVVVDDGSTDNTYRIAKKYAPLVQVYTKVNGGKHTAINHALQRAKTQLIGVLDADSTVAPNALRKIVTYFDEQETMAVTPSMVIDTPKGFLRRIQSIEFIIGIFLRRVFADIGSQHVTPGPFTIYRKTFFDKHGMYRKAHHTEDIEMALRIQTHQYHIENATDAYVYTHGPGTWNALYKQRLRWYYGFISNIIDYRHLFGPKHGNLGLFVLPMALLSVALIGTVLTTITIKFSIALFQNIYYYWLIGFDLRQLLEWNFDVFFFNTSALAILGFVSLLGSVLMFICARLFSNQKNLLGSYILFLFFYSWLYILWWISAGIHKLFKQEVLWGHKSNVGK